MIPRTSLKQLRLIAKGGFGRVYHVDDFTLPGQPSPLAFKEFTTEVAGQGRSASAAVAFRNGLSSTDRATLDRYAAWPVDVVTDPDGTVCGLLMPLIPDDFFCTLRNAATGERVRQPRQMGWLIASAQLRQDVQIDFPDAVSYTDRLLLLAQLVYAIGRLHRHGWIYGDLSFRNVVFALDPPRIMLLDCDGTAAVADTGRVQPSTRLWDPPESQAGPASQEQQDTVTDAYKLGLAILRCLSPGLGAASALNPHRIDGVLDSEGARLVAAALSDDRSVRPTAKELYTYLRAMAAPRIVPPVIVTARVATPVVQRGQQAWVDWQVAGGGEVTVMVGTDLVAKVSPLTAGRGCAFRPLTPGPVRVEVTNSYGTAVADAGYVVLFEPPAVSIGIPDVPVPPVPVPPPVSLEKFSAAFPGVPDVGASLPDLPVVSVPDLGGLLPDGVPEVRFPPLPALASGAPAIPWPDVQATFTATASALSAWLLREAELKAAAGEVAGR